MKWLPALLLFASSLALADPRAEVEMRAIQSRIDVIQQEQQSLHQQFQMIQELRRLDVQPAASLPIGYDEMVRERAEREHRATRYTLDLTKIYEQHRSLEARKTPLIARLNQLAQQR